LKGVESGTFEIFLVFYKIIKNNHVIALDKFLKMRYDRKKGSKKDNLTTYSFYNIVKRRKNLCIVNSVEKN
jgi:hypothetical protein